MKRRAILIFNDGGPSNYLPGVKVDKANYLNFLKSAEGGAWEDSEIKVYDNDCNKDLLLAYINLFRFSEQTGYWLIVFSGHGYVNSQNETMLELSPGNECSIEVIKKATVNSRRLIIADSCRLVIRIITESFKRGLKLFSNTSSSDAYRARCRALYVNQLEKVYIDSFNAAYAAEYNQCANDDDITGGYYSGELLKAASTLIVNRKSSYRADDYVVSFGVIHRIAKESVKTKSNGKQVPTTQGYGIDTIPFVVVPKN